MIELREAKGWSQSELGRRAGVAQPTINRIEAGGTRSPRQVVQIARALDTTADYLMDESDERAPGGAAEQRLPYRGPAREIDDVEIDSVDLSYGLGGTFLDVGDASVAKVRFSRSWLRKFTDAPPEVLASTEGVGDSMEPLIGDRDVVVMDRSARLEDHLSDKIWVFAFGQIGMIKRLRPLPDGTIRIMSEKPTVSDEIAVEGDIHIIGRVVASVRRH